MFTTFGLKYANFQQEIDDKASKILAINTV